MITGQNVEVTNLYKLQGYRSEGRGRKKYQWNSNGAVVLMKQNGESLALVER